MRHIGNIDVPGNTLMLHTSNVYVAILYISKLICTLEKTKKNVAISGIRA